MTKIEKLNRALLLFSLVFSLTNYSGIALGAENLENQDLAQENNVEVKSVQPKSEQGQSGPKVYYKLISGKKGHSSLAVVYIGDKEVARYTQSAGGYSPEQRAKILIKRLEQFISSNKNPNSILPGKQGNMIVCRSKDLVLFTVDYKTAKAEGLTTSELALKWSNNVRVALGAPKIVRDNSLIASRGIVSAAFARNYLGREEFGMASWYGGRFHGRRSADGSRFSKYDFTAAHKHLPFGSLVKVINRKNGKSCVVRITDRGPFVSGRIIDLSKAAAKEIGMLSSGIAHVKIEVIGKY